VLRITTIIGTVGEGRGQHWGTRAQKEREREREREVEREREREVVREYI
jgi:hypothetical protein